MFASIGRRVAAMPLGRPGHRRLIAPPYVRGLIAEVALGVVPVASRSPIGDRDAKT